MADEKPSTWAWVVVHLGYPLLPVPLEGLIRYVVSGWTFDFDTFNAATLAISAGLISVFVNQSLRTQASILPDPEEDDERSGTCVGFMALGIIFFALFAVVTLMYALVGRISPSPDWMKQILQGFQAVVFVIWIVPIIFALVAQRAFKLRASII
jgi:hypothetical protein